MAMCFHCFKEYEESLGICPYCGQVRETKPTEPIYLYPGTVLGNRYIIGEALGAGGFGIVYRAWDLKLEAIVAVKEFFVARLMTRAEGLKEVIINKKSEDEYKYRKERFLAEARTMAKFNTHRSIPNVFEFFEENNTAYIIMELLQGVTLTEYLEQNYGHIDLDFTLFIVNEVGKALISMHEQNIIHRDVAPDNIFICSGGEIKIKLMDFGAAKLADSTDDVIDVILKPGYSPVEQYDNSSKIAPSTDIYALGATLYMMLTGTKPDEATNRKIKDTVAQASELNPSIPENLNNTIMKAMAVEKHMRFKHVSEFLSALNGERKVETLENEKRKRKFRRFSGMLAACIVLAIVSAVVINSYRGKRTEQSLSPATISVWFSIGEGSSEEDAMSAVFKDFEDKFNGVNIEYTAIAESEYSQAIADAAENGNLPNLFESTLIDDVVLSEAIDLDNVLNSEQFGECLFLNQYNKYYSTKKRIPLAIEVPLAYVITSGPSEIQYEDSYFNDISDFGEDTAIAGDTRFNELINANFYDYEFLPEEDFLTDSGNTSPILISSSMIINEVRALPYSKKYVYYNADSIICRFTYEWSIGSGSNAEQRASEMLLSWMLGNVYQQMLMVNTGSANQIPEIPVNKACFETKTGLLSNLKPIAGIYNNFIFVRGEDK